MKNYIQVLQKRRLQSSLSYWNYSVSGNIIELKIIPTLKKDPDKYRIGVIQAGSIIQQCRLSMINQEHPPIIQIFPSIMENELIAIFRFSPSKNIIKKPDLQSTLQHKSKKDPLQIDPSLFSIKELPKSSCLEFLDIPKNSLAICTYTENPFTWLNVGYKGEVLKDEIKQKNGFDACTSYILKDKQEQKAISSLLTEKVTPQMVIFRL